MYDSIVYAVELTYCLKGYPKHYRFGTDKHLYNLRTNRRLKQCYKNGMIGFWIGKEFLSIKFIRENNLLYKPINIKLPF